MTSKSPHNQRHAACLILLSVNVSVPLLRLCNQKTTWLLRAESPVFAVFTIQPCSQTIGFCCGVWEFNSQDTLLNAITTNKNQCCPSWCLPEASPGSAATGQPGGICFRDSNHLNPLILMQRSSNFTTFAWMAELLPTSLDTSLDRILPAFFLFPLLDGACEHASSGCVVNVKSGAFT